MARVHAILDRHADFLAGAFVTEWPSLLSLSLSLSASFFRRFDLDLNGTCTSSKSTRFTAFLLPPSLASCRAILFNFVEALLGS